MTYTPSPSRSVSLVKLSDRTTAGGRGPIVAKLGAAFQQDSAQLALMLKYMQFAMVAGFIGIIVLLANFSTTNYRLFATTTEGKLTTPPPVDQEIGDNVVTLWVSDAMNKILTMGFHDYQLRLLEIRPLFTDRGWDSFTRFQRAPYGSNPAIRAALENDFLLMRARPKTPPLITQKVPIGGVFTYRMQVQMLVTRYPGNGMEDLNAENYEITVERVRPEVNPVGIAISQWRYMPN